MQMQVFSNLCDIGMFHQELDVPSATRLSNYEGQMMTSNAT